MSDQSEREALERAATALWKEKRGTSSRPFEWEDSRQWWEEDARIVIDAHRTALAAREEPPKIGLGATERALKRSHILALGEAVRLLEAEDLGGLATSVREVVRDVLQEMREPKP